jgi:hypothetical protein
MADEVRKHEDTESETIKETEETKETKATEQRDTTDQTGSAEESQPSEPKEPAETQPVKPEGVTEAKEEVRKEEKKAETPQEASKEAEKPKETTSPSKKKESASSKAPKKEKEKKPKKQIWKSVLKIIGICAVAAGSGFGGAYLGTQAAIQKTVDTVKEELEDSMQEIPSFPFGNNEMPSMPGFFGNEEGSSSNDTLEEGSPALGIYVQETSDGLKVSGFTNGSKAEDAGIKSGDIIKKLDGTETGSYEEVRSFLKEKEAGDTVTVTVERDGEEKEIKVELIAQQKASSSKGQKNSQKDSNSDFPSDESSTYQG